MKEKKKNEDERRRLAMIYGVDVDDTKELALMPCGASVRCVNSDSPVAALFRFSPCATDRYPLRDGDAGLFCINECVCFGRCPLVKEYLGIKPDIDLECFSKRLVCEFKAGDGDGNLSDVGDSDSSVPGGAAAPVRVRFLSIKVNGELHFVVPPMAKIVDERDDGGSSGRNDGDAGEGV